MATTPSFNWATPDNTGLVKNGALDIRTLGNAIDSSMTDLLGGTTGQVLKKNSNTDMDFVWSADSAGMTNPMTTTGDTIYSSSGSTPARLGIGSTGQVLTVASGVPSWATPSASAFAGVRVTNSADLNISNTTGTAVGFNTETFDSDGFHDNATNNSRLTIPTGKTGYYQISALIRWKNISASATVRQLRFYKNGVQLNVYPLFWSQNDDTYQVYSDLLSLSAGDYIEIYVWQNSGSTTQVLADSSFAIAKVG